MQARLVVTGGGLPPRTIELVDPLVTIGSQASVSLPDPAIARLALSLRRDATGGYIAEPIEGWVTVNGGRLAAPTAIAVDDVFRVGPFRLTVEPRRVAVGTTPPPLGAPAPRRATAMPVVLTPAARDELIADARARMAWGDSAEEVKRRLVRGGLAPGDAAALVNGMHDAERQATRSSGFKQVLAGLTVAVFGLPITMYYGYFYGFGELAQRLGFRVCLRSHALKAELVVGPALLALALGLFARGVYRVVFADREGHVLR